MSVYICYCVLSNKLLRPPKSQNHLEKIILALRARDIKCFKWLENNLKRQRFDKSESFNHTHKKLTEAPFEVNLLIAEQKKAYNIGETLVKPSTLAMVLIDLGEESEKKG